MAERIRPVHDYFQSVHRISNSVIIQINMLNINLISATSSKRVVAKDNQ